MKKAPITFIERDVINQLSSIKHNKKSFPIDCSNNEMMIGEGLRPKLSPKPLKHKTSAFTKERMKVVKKTAFFRNKLIAKI